MNQQLLVQALKYGRIPHYEWEVELLDEAEDYLICVGMSGRKLTHHTKQNVFTFHNGCLEVFSFSHWFTVSATIEHATIQQYYCNICQPIRRDGNVISFIDLDLDLVKWAPDKPWEVVDQDEFEVNSSKFGYPSSLMQRTEAELIALQNRVKNNEFPFDGTLQVYINKAIEKSLIDPGH